MSGSVSRAIPMGQGSAVSTEKMMERTVRTATSEMSSFTGGLCFRRPPICRDYLECSIRILWIFYLVVPVDYIRHRIL